MKLEREVVYGPVQSRRFGLDLGINLLPADHKTCTFECVYCQLGFADHRVEKPIHFPKADDVMRLWESRLKECRDHGLQIWHTTLAGNGEPTMHPEFPYLVQRLVQWRNENAPHLRLAVLSNGYRIHISEIRYALGLLDEPVLKLDAGDPALLCRINQPQVHFDLGSYVNNLKKISHVMLQTMFLKGWNDSKKSIKHWIDIIRDVQPESVQIYSIDRPPATLDLKPLSSEELAEIARDASLLSGVPVQAH